MADLMSLVFEGPSHPYKENLMKVDGRTRGSEVSTIKVDVSMPDPEPL